MEKTYYEETVVASQAETREAQRTATSPPPEIRIIGTATETARTPVPADTLITAQEEITVTVSPMPSNTLEATETPTEVPTSSVKIVRTATTTQTITPTQVVIVVRSTPTPAQESTVVVETEVMTNTSSVAGTPLPVNTPDPTATPTPYRPGGLVEIEDVLSESMLTERARKDMDDDAISDLRFILKPDGFQVQGTYTTQTIPRISQPLDVKGTFVVRNDSLTTDISSIFVGNTDVTDGYRPGVERGLDSSLYRLLPQRYVQTYEIVNGELVVQSLIRP